MRFIREIITDSKIADKEIHLASEFGNAKRNTLSVEIGDGIFALCSDALEFFVRCCWNVGLLSVNVCCSCLRKGRWFSLDFRLQDADVQSVLSGGIECVAAPNRVSLASSLCAIHTLSVPGQAFRCKG